MNVRKRVRLVVQYSTLLLLHVHLFFLWELRWERFQGGREDRDHGIETFDDEEYDIFILPTMVSLSCPGCSFCPWLLTVAL